MHDEEIVARAGVEMMEVDAESKPGEEAQQYAMHSPGAVFAEVRVDPSVGEMRVPRVTDLCAAGRVLNLKAVTGQMLSGVVWGLGVALMEHTTLDARNGRDVTADLAEYLMPGSRDVPAIDV